MRVFFRLRLLSELWGRADAVRQTKPAALADYAEAAGVMDGTLVRSERLRGLQAPHRFTPIPSASSRAFDSSQRPGSAACRAIPLAHLQKRYAGGKLGMCTIPVSLQQPQSG